jgi:hypothetical protein
VFIQENELKKLLAHAWRSQAMPTASRKIFIASFCFALFCSSGALTFGISKESKLCPEAYAYAQ